MNTINHFEFDNPIKFVLANMFETWTEAGVDGCVQGYGFTDILLKIAMAPIDRAMINEFGDDVSYYRYCDDIQIVANSKQDLQSAYEFLDRQLKSNGMSLKYDQILRPEPGKTDIGHAYQPHKEIEKFLEDAKETNKIAQDYSFDKDNLHPNLTGLAFQSYISPSLNGGRKPNKYLWSYIFRHLRKFHDHQKAENPEKFSKLEQLAPKLMDVYPERLPKIIQALYKKGANVNMSGILVQRYFALDTADERDFDYHRLVILDAFKKTKYQMPPQVVPMLAHGIFHLSISNPQVFSSFSTDIIRLQDLDDVQARRDWRGKPLMN